MAIDPAAWTAAAIQPLPGSEGDPVAPASLVGACSGARVVGIGEFSHGTHDDAALKSSILLGLIDAGAVDTVYVEANRAGAAELDEFLRKGDGDAEAAVRSAAVFRVLKTKAFASLVAGMRDRVARGMSLRIVGIDCQDTTRDARFAIRRLAARDPQRAAAAESELAAVVGPGMDVLRHVDVVKSLELARLDACVAALARLRLDLEGDSLGAMAALRAQQGLECFRPEAKDATAEHDTPEPYLLRDRFMAENILAEAPQKAAFWGHNIHVLGGVLRGNMEGYRPTGSYLREALGADYRVVAFDYRNAQIRAVVVTGNELPDARNQTEVLTRSQIERGIVDALSGFASGSCWCDVSAMPEGDAFEVWRSTPRRFDWPGYAASRERRDEEMVEIPLDRLIDVIVVQESVGPSKELQ